MKLYPLRLGKSTYWSATTIRTTSGSPCSRICRRAGSAKTSGEPCCNTKRGLFDNGRLRADCLPRFLPGPNGVGTVSELKHTAPLATDPRS
jgi:hypothetical protein